MKSLIKLKSRREESNILKKLTKADGSESYTYILKTSVYNMKGGLTDRGKQFLSLVGGPTIVEGEYLKEAEATVKSIDYLEGKGYIITFNPILGES